ncbi:MAG: SMC-Scp complex subunit ScpB [Proteobacteria bacterium]|nr:SMC-Scp complex subunit ScpB [Pseudomonadota bacterium]
MDDNAIKYFVESALLAAGRPLSIDQLQGLFEDHSMPEKPQIRQAISDLLNDYAERGITITEVASGFRMQIEGNMVARLQKLWEERPPRYSRALFETLALIAYRQPITRGEIEEVRGVAVSANIVRALMEREWIRVVGHRDVPGRPAMFGTTKLFLDYFGLKKLDDLPPLADLSDWESLRVQLNLPAVDENDDESFGDSGGGGVADIPVLFPQSDEEVDDNNELLDEFIDNDMNPSQEVDIEPIEATEWPDPKNSQVVSSGSSLSEADDESDHQMYEIEAEDEDADASLTGA